MVSRVMLSVVARIAEQFAPAKPVGLPVWLDSLDSVYRVPVKARSTCLRVLQACRDTVAWAGLGATTADLNPDLVEGLARHWQEGRAAATVNGLLRGLRAGCNHAILRGWLVINPFEVCSPWVVEAVPRRRAFLGRADVRRLLDALAMARDWSGRRLHALASVWAYAGLRRDEALLLEWVDVTLSGPSPSIEVRPHFVARNRRVGLKTPSSVGVVPICRELVDVLTRWRASVPRGVAWVFPGVRLDGPWTGGRGGRRAGDALRDAAEAIGLSGVTPHVLRHSCATFLRGACGLSPEQARRVLRHGSAGVQEHYLHIDLDAIAATIAPVVY